MKTLEPLAFDRRYFFKLLGGGIFVAFCSPALRAQESGRGGGGRRGGPQRPMEVSAWLHIGEDGAVQVFTGKTEVGQNIRTSLSQAVAEELQVPISAIRMLMADTDLVPFDMGTFGSRTTPDMALHLRKVAAAAREALIDLAVKEWGFTDRHVRAVDGRVIYERIPGQVEKSTGYGELLKGQKLAATVTEQTKLKPASEWKVAGTPVPKVDGREFVTGRHHYTTDMSLPGMLHGKVLRAPAYGAKLKSLDDSQAKAMEGVSIVSDGDFVGVTAPNPATATKAIEALVAEWEGGGGPSNKELWDILKNDIDRGEQGAKIDEALAAAGHKLEQTCHINYIAHCPLETRAGLAEWKDGKLTVWTGTQRPFGVKDELVSAFSLPPDKVRVIVPDTGSGYGGKHSGEAAVEAARLAKAVGKPVKLAWTREEEFRWAYLRPAALIEVKAAIDDQGKLSAWEFHSHNPGGAALETPYAVPVKLVRSHGSKSPLRQGSYRGLAASANNFARETAMDELAAIAGLDSLEFRLRNLEDERLSAVLKAVAERFGWKDRKGHCGIACGIDKGGYVANCVELEVKGGDVQLKRIVAAFECGAVVNPLHLKNQIEGSIVMGLGGALSEAIQFADGKILNPRFSQYRVPRFSDVPPIEIILLDRKDLPSAGAGECPIMAIAPAIAGAIHAATGERRRAMPML
ncbi:molybdopterin cofactor-binding domain-containing protein [Haloferula sp. BvORR071]|uniref:xanthine dehydrogenase family protein molybdopterin-binding subunit n=1 Tax=Haloferula sp. BvORR071 TaxID=1396141 RepID=UPI00055283E3|nr:molybdopterin cofactor-binding domain-containing protein [Haloferula sp. BvORR071]